MSSVIEKKKGVVQEITDRFRDSQTTVIVNYRGLDVAEVTELRKQLREAGVEYKVYKNSMTQRAATNVELDDLHEVLVGPTAVAFSKDDVIAPAKIINNFAKDHDALEIKGGVIDGELASIEQIKELAQLPDHEGLVSMLLSVLQAPIRNLAYATKAISEQKEEQEA
ncbi:MAG TPA: 50S ribosomal protein L10 [Virgibacillus sp.]|nr:50S ribosomal protein L10 [Virgibacillus sp.]